MKLSIISGIGVVEPESFDEKEKLFEFVHELKPLAAQWLDEVNDIEKTAHRKQKEEAEQEYKEKIDRMCARSKVHQYVLAPLYKWLASSPNVDMDDNFSMQIKIDNLHTTARYINQVPYNLWQFITPIRKETYLNVLHFERDVERLYEELEMEINHE